MKQDATVGGDARADVDDASVLTAAHEWYGGFRAGEDALQVLRDMAVPVQRRFTELAGAHCVAGRIIDQTVDASEMLHHRPGHLGRFGFNRGVHRYCDGTSAFGLDLLSKAGFVCVGNRYTS